MRELNAYLKSLKSNQVQLKNLKLSDFYSSKELDIIQSYLYNNNELNVYQIISKNDLYAQNKGFPLAMIPRPKLSVKDLFRFGHSASYTSIFLNQSISIQNSFQKFILTHEIGHTTVDAHRIKDSAFLKFAMPILIIPILTNSMIDSLILQIPLLLFIDYKFIMSGNLKEELLADSFSLSVLEISSDMLMQLKSMLTKYFSLYNESPIQSIRKENIDYLIDQKILCKPFYLDINKYKSFFTLGPIIMISLILLVFGSSRLELDHQIIAYTFGVIIFASFVYTSFDEIRLISLNIDIDKLLNTLCYEKRNNRHL